MRGVVVVEADHIIASVVIDGDIDKTVGDEWDIDRLEARRPEFPITVHGPEGEKGSTIGIAQAHLKDGIAVGGVDHRGEANYGMVTGGIAVDAEIRVDGCGIIGMPGETEALGGGVVGCADNLTRCRVERGKICPAGLVGNRADGIGVEVVPEVFLGMGGGQES